MRIGHKRLDLAKLKGTFLGQSMLVHINEDKNTGECCIQLVFFTSEIKKNEIHCAYMSG